MAKTKKKTFENRLEEWLKNKNSASKDTELQDAAILAWNTYTQDRPLTASLVLSVLLTLYKLYAMNDNAAVNLEFLENELEIEPLEKAVIAAVFSEPNDWTYNVLFNLPYIDIDRLSVVLGVLLLTTAVAEKKLAYGDISKAVIEVVKLIEANKEK